VVQHVWSKMVHILFAYIWVRFGQKKRVKEIFCYMVFACSCSWNILVASSWKVHAFFPVVKEKKRPLWWPPKLHRYFTEVLHPYHDTYSIFRYFFDTISEVYQKYNKIKSRCLSDTLGYSIDTLSHENKEKKYDILVRELE
jgi:hypothetical protein